MSRSKCSMGSSRGMLGLLALHLVACTSAGPLGPLPIQNLTGADMGLKEGSCALGDVVYMVGDEFPGSGPCERCACAAGGVRCAQQQCEPRPGCKALHRPDHCCPTYQCECEQEGRVYGNGEKLVDPADPCRVCYCQGGEVVCRRIACFVRDDCTPRRVPGRCCPEYDNCPLRGVTSLPGVASSPALTPVVSTEGASAAATDVVKPAITIKEITPKAEIPIITDVKIKEILPSPSIEVADYSSSKSPLITREATSQKTNTEHVTPKAEQEMPSVVEVHSLPENISSEDNNGSSDMNGARAPSKISLSTQDSINSEIYPLSPIVPIVATMGTPIIDASHVASTTKAPVMIEEEDPLLFDHNPAFPPLPDDFSNHGDEIIQEPSIDLDHVPLEHLPEEKIAVLSTSTTTESENKKISTTTVKNLPVSSEVLPELSITPDSTSTVAPALKENPTVKLRSAIPTDILSTSSEVTVSNKVNITESDRDITTTTSTSSPNESTTILSTVSEDTYTDNATAVFGKVAESEETTKANEIHKYEDIINSEEIGKSQEILKSEEITYSGSSNSDEKLDSSHEISTAEPEAPFETVSFVTADPEPVADSQLTTEKVQDLTRSESTPSITHEKTTNSIAKSNIATEVTSQTELLSSLPIETSDQNPHESSVSENVSKDSVYDVSTGESIADLSTTTDKPASADIVSESKTSSSRIVENVETTEFILTSFGSSESSTDAVELIKIPGDADKNAAIIDRADGNKNALTDLIKLVSDVASMSDHTEAPATIHQAAHVDSEELLPVNAGYKSKNSNFNQNSITEIPFKSKSATVNKQKGVEIEDDDEPNISDSPPPNDKAEPTTRRAIIDNVSDDMPPSKTDKKDIEIITQSYVPTINRRPTKVVLKEDQPEHADSAPSPAPPATSAPTDTSTRPAHQHTHSETETLQ